MSPHPRSSYGNVLEICKGRWCWVEDVRGWSRVQDIAMAVGFLPHSLSLHLRSAGSECVILCSLGWTRLPWGEVVFITAAFFITELPHNNFCPPAFLYYSLRKINTSFSFLSPSNVCFLFLLSLINIKILTDISCFPSSEFSPFLIIRQLLACCFFFFSFFFFFLEDHSSGKQNDQCSKHQRGSLLGHCVVHILSILAVNTSFHMALLNSDLVSAALWKSLWNLVVFLAWQRAINLEQRERTFKKKLAMKINTSSNSGWFS